jgi:hypothetical protein
MLSIGSKTPSLSLGSKPIEPELESELELEPESEPMDNIIYNVS